MGHFSADINIYIKDKIFKSKNSIDFVSFNKLISNKILLNAFNKYFINVPYFIIEPFFYLNKFKFLNSEKNFIKFNKNTSRDYSKLRNKIIKYDFSKSEQNTKKFLEKFNIDINKDKIVLIFARDEYFLEKTFPKIKTNYHNFRNTNINNLKLTSNYLARRGYYVFRIGKFPKTKISFENKKIIDYGFKYWSEDLDIGLAKFCSFVISNGSGAESIADNIFNKPILLYSYVPMGFINTFASKCMYLPKNHYFKNSKKKMNISQIYKQDLLFETNGHKYNKINLLECNKYQILGACKEFLNLINNNFKIKKNKTQINFEKKFLYFLSERYKMINRVKIDAYYMLAKTKKFNSNISLEFFKK